MGIVVKVEGERGCGFRKGGGLYLMTEGEGRDCGKLPLKLDVCPCCGQGVKPSRAWTWIDPRPLFEGVECRFTGEVELADGSEVCDCPLADHRISEIERGGLLWIGESFYPTPAEWMAEGKRMGFSRRISAIPRGFVLGETWVFAAHRKAVCKPCPTCSGSGLTVYGEGTENESREACPECKGEKVVCEAAIFHVFRPTAIEYVVKGDETEEEIEAIEKRGITCVKVVKEGEQIDFDEVDR